jgi:hypothetical protein
MEYEKPTHSDTLITKFDLLIYLASFVANGRNRLMIQVMNGSTYLPIS